MDPGELNAYTIYSFSLHQSCFHGVNHSVINCRIAVKETWQLERDFVRVWNRGGHKGLRAGWQGKWFYIYCVPGDRIWWWHHPSSSHKTRITNGDYGSSTHWLILPKKKQVSDNHPIVPNRKLGFSSALWVTKYHLLLSKNKFNHKMLATDHVDNDHFAYSHSPRVLNSIYDDWLSERLTAFFYSYLRLQWSKRWHNCVIT